ncbi:LpqB family beta-propeller domain-containing protein [Embleya sp. NBC_00896]|uniref:LpqB family beta-propeller domain-containing protein n=1 Tax=Embleya sp. NBC_00896 TaxID=2975961 RepID=UPI0038657497|nr:LpqB family beta-propeller domain-containing protein [Embleya sp. NBC_00896]
MRRINPVVALVCALGTLCGCASMPNSGSVRETGKGDTKEKAPEQQVRVFAVPPKPGEEPYGLASGFLEAVTSDEPDYVTARAYLAPDAKAKWVPTREIVVLDSSPRIELVPGVDEKTYTVEVSGTRVGTVDDRNAYQPAAESDAPYRAVFRLAKGTDNEWRITDLPDGLILSEPEFHRIYRSVNTYWFASSMPVGKDSLVPDPVYLRSRVGLTTALVRQLLSGPTDWLRPVVDTAFPAGTDLAERTVSIEDNRTARVELSGQAKLAQTKGCERMAAQLLYTLRQVSGVDSVSITGGGSPMCSLSDDDAARYDPVPTRGTLPTGYFIGKGGVVNVVPVAGGNPPTLPGPFGDGTYKFDQIAVSRDPLRRRIAGVNSSGHKLVVGDVDGRGEVREWLSLGPASLLSPTWDGRGVLWVLDRTKGAEHVFALYEDERNQVTVVPVSVQNVDPSRITGLRLSPDGTRAAMIVDGGKVLVGRVERHISNGEVAMTIAASRSVVPSLVEVKAISWNGQDRLAVLGKEGQGALQPQIVDIDGGISVSVASVNGMLHIAAPDGADQPLLADSSEENIYQLSQGNNWTKVHSGGYPVYPG